MDTNLIKINKSIDEARERLKQASSEEQFQAIGLLCRETLISLAQAIYDPNLHAVVNGQVPSKTDVKGMIEAYLQTEYSGSTYELYRKYLRATVDLANELQHKRSASLREAELCYEATNSVVRFFLILDGQSDYLSRQIIFVKVQRQMPDLIAEMTSDLVKQPLVREFVLSETGFLLNIRKPCFIYYSDQHEYLSNKIHILENQGLVRDVTSTNLPRYRLSEEFVEQLLLNAGEVL